MALLAAVAPTAAERGRPLPGDDLVPRPDVVMDRAFDLPAPPDRVWPWIVQLGRGRAGWYLPRAAERFVPPSRRALRHVEPTLQHPAVGDTVPDWGGRDAGLTVALLQPPTALVHTSVRGATGLSWALVLRPATGGTTRMHLRLRLAPVRRRRLVRAGGGLLDELTVAALAAGLRERLRDRPGGA